MFTFKTNTSRRPPRQSTFGLHTFANMFKEFKKPNIKTQVYNPCTDWVHIHFLTCLGNTHACMHPSVAPSASTVFGCVDFVDFDDCDDCDGVFRPLFHIAATRWVARSPSRKRVQHSRHTKRRFRPRGVGAVCVVRRHTTRTRPFRWAAQRCFVPKWGRTCLRKACRTRAALAVLAWRGR